MSVDTTRGSAGKTARNRWLRPIRYAAFGLMLLAGMGAAYYEYHDAHRVPRFGCVVPGVLYRSGQPAVDGLEHVILRHHIRTVVILRGHDELREDPRVDAERRVAAEYGIRIVHLPYDEDRVYPQLRTFLDIMAESSHHPVLIHCAKGRDRTGLFVLAYRMVMQRWERDRAVAEMREYGSTPDEAPGIWRFLDEFAPERI